MSPSGWKRASGNTAEQTWDLVAEVVAQFLAGRG